MRGNLGADPTRDVLLATQWGTQFYAYPFELPQRPATQSRYRLYLHRFLCYVFRAWHLCQRQRQSVRETYGFLLSASQVQTTELIWSELTALSLAEAASATVLSPPSVLRESLFQLLVMFWTDISADGVVEGKATINFSGVLGIHPYELAFRTAYDCTPYLSALIWVGRLIILEYALPLQAYRLLPTPWPARATYTNQDRRLCVDIRPHYLQRGSFSLIGYFIERLQHGRAIAKCEGARTNMSWSLDGQTLSIASASITMQAFRQTIHLLLARTEQETRTLMLDWWPTVDLHKIKDDIAKHRPGYSFL
jgi:hypothetical protein